MGGNLYPSSHQLARAIAYDSIEKLNSTIANNKFNVGDGALLNKHKFKYTADMWCKTNDRPYILVEVPGQNKLQVIEDRISQMKIIINTAIDHMLKNNP